MNLTTFTWVETFPVYEEGDKVTIDGMHGVYEVEYATIPERAGEGSRVKLKNKFHTLPCEWISLYNGE